MLAVDVKVLVYAHRSDTDGHDAWRDWVDGARRGPEPLGLIDQVLAGFVRIVTHPRVFARPSSVDEAFRFVTLLQDAPALAIESGATWCTADRGFARYPGLRWRHPLDTAP